MEPLIFSTIIDVNRRNPLAKFIQICYNINKLFFREDARRGNRKQMVFFEGNMRISWS